MKPAELLQQCQILYRLLVFFPGILCVISFSVSGSFFLSSFSSDLLLFAPKLFHHLLCSQFHCLALCVLLLCFPPTSPPLLPPLGFSLMERLSDEGNDRMAVFDGAEWFKHRRLKRSRHLCEMWSMKHVDGSRKRGVNLHECRPVYLLYSTF